MKAFLVLLATIALGWLLALWLMFAFAWNAGQAPVSGWSDPSEEAAPASRD